MDTEKQSALEKVKEARLEYRDAFFHGPEPFFELLREGVFTPRVTMIRVFVHEWLSSNEPYLTVYGDPDEECRDSEGVQLINENSCDEEPELYDPKEILSWKDGWEIHNETINPEVFRR